MGLAAGLQLETLVVRLATDRADYEAGLRSAEQAFATYTMRVNALAASAAFQISAHMANVFIAADEQMTHGLALMRNLNPETRRILEDSAIRIASDSIGSMRDVSNIFYEMARAGYSASHSLEAVSIAERFFVVNNMEAANSTRNLIRLMNGLGLSSNDALENAQNLQRVADVVTALGLRSQTANMDQFLHGLERLAPSLRAVGRPLEEGAALLATFTTMGIEAGEATSSVVRLLQNLQRLSVTRGLPNPREAQAQQFGRPAGNMIPGVHPLHAINAQVRQSQASWRALGIEVFDQAGNMRPMVDVLEQLEGNFQGLSHEQRMARLGQLGFEQNNMLAITRLMGHSAQLREFIQIGRTASGVMEEIYSARMMSFSSQIRILVGHFEALGIEIGRILLPYMREMNAIVTDALRGWREMPSAARETIIIMGLLFALFTSLRILLPVVIGMLHLFWRSTIGAAWMVTVSGLRLVLGLLMIVGQQLLYVEGYFEMLLRMTGRFILAFTNMTYALVFFSAQAVYHLGGMLLSVLFTLVGVVAAFSVHITIMAYRLVAMSVAFMYLLLNLAMTRVAFLTLFTTLQGIIVAFAVGFWSAIRAVTYGFFGLIAAMVRFAAVSSFNIMYTMLNGIAQMVWSIVQGVIELSVATLMLTTSLSGIAFLAIVAGLLLVIMYWDELVQMIDDFSWDDFLAASEEFVWNVIGFFVNFQENLGSIWDWLGENWDLLLSQMSGWASDIFLNIYERFMNMLGAIIGVLYLFVMNAIDVLFNLNVGQEQINQLLEQRWVAMLWNLLSAWVAFCADILLFWVNGIIRILSHLGILEDRLRNFRIGDMLRDMRIELPRMAPLRLNLSIPPDLRALISSLPSALGGMLSGGGEGRAQTPTQLVGDTFKEMSLRRFALDLSTEHVSRSQVVQAPGVESRLDIIINHVREFLGLPPRAIVGR